MVAANNSQSGFRADAFDQEEHADVEQTDSPREIAKDWAGQRCGIVRQAQASVLCVVLLMHEGPCCVELVVLCAERVRP